MTNHDGVERHVTPWPDWAITTQIDTRSFWTTVWQAVSCHESQALAYERLKDLPPELREGIWGRQSFYRVFSTVNGGRIRRLISSKGSLYDELYYGTVEGAVITHLSA